MRLTSFACVLVLAASCTSGPSASIERACVALQDVLDEWQVAFAGARDFDATSSLPERIVTFDRAATDSGSAELADGARAVRAAWRQFALARRADDHALDALRAVRDRLDDAARECIRLDVQMRLE